jgi:tetratricopeptide (TPR) repeat protein
MDFSILPQLTIVLSAAGILFIIGRNFSKVKQASEAELLIMEASTETRKEKEKIAYLYKRAIRRVNKENYQKTVTKFWLWFEKTLRKLRINFMKLDGKIVAYLEELRKKNTVSIEKLKESERSFRKNMENENFSKFWNAKRQEIKTKSELKKAGQFPMEESALDSVYSDIPAARVVGHATVNEPSAADEEPTETKILETPVLRETDPATTSATEIETTDSIAHVAPEATFLKEKTANKKVSRFKDIPVIDSDTALTSSMQGESPANMSPEAESPSIQTDKTETEKIIKTQKEREYIEALMKDPADIKAYWKLGLIYSKRRNYEDSLACFRQIVKIDPTYTKAKQKAIELMEKMKKKGK